MHLLQHNQTLSALQLPSQQQAALDSHPRSADCQTRSVVMPPCRNPRQPQRLASRLNPHQPLDSRLNSAARVPLGSRPSSSSQAWPLAMPQLSAESLLLLQLPRSASHHSLHSLRSLQAGSVRPLHWARSPTPSPLQALLVPVRLERLPRPRQRPPSDSQHKVRTRPHSGSRLKLRAPAPLANRAAP